MSSREQHGHLAVSYLITAGTFALMLALHIDCFLSRGSSCTTW